MSQNKRAKNDCKMLETEDTATKSEIEESSKIVFTPPLYIKRYEYVERVIRKYDCKSVLDVGCAECKLIRYVKNNTQMQRDSQAALNFIVGIDINEELLRNSVMNLLPYSLDYIQKRREPLEMHIIAGDISKPSDEFLKKFSNSALDCVSLVEVIEHMYDDCLTETIQVIFGKLQPNIVIITTPNSEFNVLFENNDTNNNELCNKNTSETSGNSNNRKRMRHWDHKFEWTREEFEDWCQNIFQKYGDIYETCEFDGVGEPPSEYSHVGSCSQICIFKKRKGDNEEPSMQRAALNSYIEKIKQTNGYKEQPSFITLKHFDKDGFKLIDTIQYPFNFMDLHTGNNRTQAIQNEIEWIVSFLTSPRSGQRERTNEEIKEMLENNLSIDESDYELISVSKMLLFSCMKKFSDLSESELLRIIKEYDRYPLTKNEKFIIFHPMYHSPMSSRSHSNILNDEFESKCLSEFNEIAQVPTTENWGEEESWSCDESPKVDKKNNSQFSDADSSSDTEAVPKPVELSAKNDLSCKYMMQHSSENTSMSSTSENNQIDPKTLWRNYENGNSYYNYLSNKDFQSRMRLIRRKNRSELRKLQRQHESQSLNASLIHSASQSFTPINQFYDSD